jgi:Zn-dependent peptidase ImmA (M78 family)
MNERIGHVPTQPGRFRLARELRGLTQTEVVSRMLEPITFAALSQIESGKTRPQEGTVRQLALALDVPHGFFSLPMPTDVDAGEMAFFRDLRATSVRDRRRASALAVVVHDLLCVIENEAILPEFDLGAAPTLRSSQESVAEQAAQWLRRSWSLGEEPISNLVREMERHGVAVVRLTMGTREVDAFSVQFDQRPLVLLTNDKPSYVRSRFDAAHELGHIVLHRSARETSRELERQAHEFASALLLPRSVALEELPRAMDGSGWTKLAQLKRKWGISIAALLFRSKDLGLLSPIEFKNAMRYMSVRGWRKMEPGDREMGPPEVPVLVERSIRAIELNSGISLAQLTELAMVPLEDMKEVVLASRDIRPGVDL